MCTARSRSWRRASSAGARRRRWSTRCCVELFAAEMVTKGLAPMVRGRDFDALARLYRYCADVAQLPELRRGLAAFVEVGARPPPHA